MDRRNFFKKTGIATLGMLLFGKVAVASGKVFDYFQGGCSDRCPDKHCPENGIIATYIVSIDGEKMYFGRTYNIEREKEHQKNYINYLIDDLKRAEKRELLPYQTEESINEIYGGWDEYIKNQKELVEINIKEDDDPTYLFHTLLFKFIRRDHRIEKYSSIIKSLNPLLEKKGYDFKKFQDDFRDSEKRANFIFRAIGRA